MVSSVYAVVFLAKEYFCWQILIVLYHEKRDTTMLPNKIKGEYGKQIKATESRERQDPVQTVDKAFFMQETVMAPAT